MDHENKHRVIIIRSELLEDGNGPMTFDSTFV